MEEDMKFLNIKKSQTNSSKTYWYKKYLFSEICHKSFPYNSSLIKHIRVHTGEKPYFCFINGCQKSFSQASNLMRHRRSHSGVKPFICEDCGKTFNSKANLKSHTIIHESIMQRTRIDCFIKDCQKNFLYLSTFKKHLKKVHPVEFQKISKSFPKQTFKYIMKNIFSKKLDFVIENKIETNDLSYAIEKEGEEKDLSIQKNVEFSIINLQSSSQQKNLYINKNNDNINNCKVENIVQISSVNNNINNINDFSLKEQGELHKVLTLWNYFQTVNLNNSFYTTAN